MLWTRLDWDPSEDSCNWYQGMQWVIEAWLFQPAMNMLCWLVLFLELQSPETLGLTGGLGGRLKTAFFMVLFSLLWLHLLFSGLKQMVPWFLCVDLCISKV